MMEFMEIHLFNSTTLGLEFGMEFQTGIQCPIPVLKSSKQHYWNPVMDSSLESSLESRLEFQ